ncbi:MAG: double-strand break repair helicase AddA [Henriciella sp.]|nr:double-strand break repair helicase AddA [Henriciella sp.]
MTEAVRSPDTPAFQRAVDAQAQAADPARSAWVEANAGAGKTKVLIDRVARLLLRRSDGRPGAPPDSILCVTYTKAAANEMLSRLFDRLGGWAIASDATLRENLSRLEGRPPSDYADEDFREARRLFARALETPGGLRIETIHAFCARILRRFPLEAGVSPGFREIEDAEADAVWRAVLGAHLQEAAEAHPEALAVISEAAGGRGAAAALEALKSKRQDIAAFARTVGADQSAIEARVRDAVGAGTETPNEIIARVMGDELPRAQIATLADRLSGHPKATQKDAKLAAAIRLACSDEPAEVRWAAYVSAFRTQKDWGKLNPYGAAHKDDAEIAHLFQVKDGQGTEVARLQQAYEEIKAARVAEQTLALMVLGLPMVKAYAHEKAVRAALDFDDLIERTRGLLTSADAAQWVLYKLDGGLTHVLLDEAQDTSPPQWTLINSLVQEFQAGEGRDRAAEPRTQFVVGDAKQSIYSFQGADQQHFEAERLGFVSREERVQEHVNLPEMSMSFRSSPEVLTFVDEVLARVPLASAATDPLPPREADLLRHDPRRANQPGRVELWPLCMPEEREDEDSDWTAPTDHVPENAPVRQLAREIAEAVKAMIDRGETVWKEGTDRSWSRAPIAPQDVLILVRRRNALFNALIESLKSVGLPVAGADRLRLIDNLGVQDCLNLIRFALQPADDLTLAEILRGPFCNLVDDNTHLFVLAHGREPGETLWDRLQASESEEFAAAKAFCRGLIAARPLAAFDFLSEVLNTRLHGVSGWDRLLQRLGEPVRDPIQALLDRALGHDMREAASLQAFLAEIEGDTSELKRDLGEPEREVRVMTVHGAKGLQAPVVILPDTTSATRKAEDAVFVSSDGVPIYSPSPSGDDKTTRQMREAKSMALERESRRLLYVAMTRAQDRLIICGAGMKSPKAGFAKSSWYRWCLTAMTALLGGDDPGADMPPVPESILVFGADVPTRPKAVEAQTSLLLAPDWLTRPAPKPVPPARLASPSQLLEDDAAVAEPFGAGRKAGLRRGRLIHGLLQVLPEVAEADRADMARRFLSRASDVTDAQAEEMLATTLATLSEPGFAPVFASGGRSEAAIVGAMPDGRTINGRVDRLVITDKRVLIVDYKTDRPAPERAEEIGLSYLVQMAAYRHVLQQIYPMHAIECALLYTDGPKFISLPGDLLSESLNRTKSGL